ncbi:MAG: hypothetical protein CVT47_01775 [Thermoplasmata archaeon HGW-Thermoplasmata-2]|nr:MAG: hypothetical protein CVT47_01775 [Thermoplasmata archaeon HGW-Thermoplasmata-2]
MMYKMKIAVLGAGAIGSLFGAYLSRFCDVLLVGRREHVEAVNAAGLQITGVTDRVFEVKAAEKIPDENFDLIIITTKAYDTEKAALSVPPKLRSKALFLSLQNGLTNYEALRRHVPEKNILLGITAQGATFLEPGHIEHAGAGETTIGAPCKSAAQAHENDVALIAELFNDAGLPCRVSGAVMRDVWTKAAINSAINPVTAITGLRNGEMLDVEPLARLCESIAKESAEVARAAGGAASGVALDKEFSQENSEQVLSKITRRNIVPKLTKILIETAANKSSMLQDIERGRRTEIESINGEIARVGAVHGVPTPLNNAIAALVKGIERSTTGTEAGIAYCQGTSRTKAPSRQD